MALVKYPRCEGTELKVYDMSGNVIGFVLMGGVAVVVAACSFVKAKAKGCAIDGQLIYLIKQNTGCNTKQAIKGMQLMRKFINDASSQGILLSAIEIDALWMTVYEVVIADMRG